MIGELEAPAFTVAPRLGKREVFRSSPPPPDPLGLLPILTQLCRNELSRRLRYFPAIPNSLVFYARTTEETSTALRFSSLALCSRIVLSLKPHITVVFHASRALLRMQKQQLSQPQLRIQVRTKYKCMISLIQSRNKNLPFLGIV